MGVVVEIVWRSCKPEHVGFTARVGLAVQIDGLANGGFGGSNTTFYCSRGEAIVNVVMDQGG